MNRFSAIYVLNGAIRHVTLEAIDLAEAQEIARKWGIGIEGELQETGPIKPVKPEAYDLQTTRQLLGGISRASIYQFLADGRLERVRHTRRLLITRVSIERFVR